MSTYGDVMRPVLKTSEMIRVRLQGELRERWHALLQDKKITQQNALESMIDFVVNADQLTQSMLFKQVGTEDHPALERIVLKRLAERARG